MLYYATLLVANRDEKRFLKRTTVGVLGAEGAGVPTSDYRGKDYPFTTGVSGDASDHGRTIGGWEKAGSVG